MTDPISRLNAALEGRYRIEREIGAGGMATVYLAEDVRHHRKVALKVLRPDLAAVVGAERFLAEIETTANLQHPHILPLFDSGEADGFLFYVMPYVEGESLREKLDREKQLTIEDALDIAGKIASALKYAHTHEVVHRDIKPGNILLNDAGEPVVADFGIALALAHAGQGRVTETGMSLGTPHYMSPEQATGEQAVDPRTDVYALGCVLYEMLTGLPPYTGATAQAVLGQILTGDPRPPSRLRKSVPRHVEEAILKALETLPADRFESAEAFANALGDPGFKRGRVRAGRADPPVRNWRGVAVAASVTTVALALVLLGRSFLGGGPEPAAERYVLSPEGWAGMGGPFAQYAAAAPDGSSLILPLRAESGGYQLGLKLKESAEIVPIPGTRGATDPVYSPDGRSMAYALSGELFRWEIGGGTPTRLSENVDVSGGAVALDWLDDGTILYETDVVESGFREVHRISQDTGELLEVVAQAEDGIGTERIATVWVEGLPDGKGALLIGCPGTGCSAPVANLYALAPGDPEPRLLREEVTRVWYMSSGHVVYVRSDGAVLTEGFDPDDLALDGPPIPLFDGVRIVGPRADMVLGSNGGLLYVEGAGGAVTSELVWVNRSGAETPVPNAPRLNFQDAVLSPNDDRIALSIVSASPDVWVLRLPEGVPTQLTFEESTSHRPVWIDDGSAIAYRSIETTNLGHVRRVPADGSSMGRSEILFELPGVNIVQFALAPDGLLFRANANIGFADPATGDGVGDILGSTFTEQNFSISHDGRWLAYSSLRQGDTPDVFVRPYPALNTQEQVSIGGGSEPVWAHNGEELFYRDPVTDSMMVATYTTDPTFRITGRDALFDAAAYRGGVAFQFYDVASDDQRFLMIKDALDSVGPDEGSARLILIQNWTTLLEERLGAER